MEGEMFTNTLRPAFMSALPQDRWKQKVVNLTILS